jgi:hypothetical protein
MPVTGQPHRTFYNGEEYVSVLGAAQALGVSRSTVKRLEGRGVLDRPQGIPRGNGSERWYRLSDLEAAREALGKQSGFRLTALRSAADQVRRESEKVPRRRSWSEVDEDDGAPPKEESRAVSPVLCPRCEDEAVYLTRSVPGGGVRQVPWCLRCDLAVDLAVPEAQEDTCVRCGGEVVWQIRESGQGFVAVCAQHDVVEVHQRKRAQPQPSWASFPAMSAPSAGRRRGLGPGDVVGAIRIPRPDQSSGPVFLDPYQGPTRPA